MSSTRAPIKDCAFSQCPTRATHNRILGWRPLTNKEHAQLNFGMAKEKRKFKIRGTPPIILSLKSYTYNVRLVLGEGDTDGFRLLLGRCF